MYLTIANNLNRRDFLATISLWYQAFILNSIVFSFIIVNCTVFSFN